MNHSSLTLSAIAALLPVIAGTALAGTPIDERRPMDSNGLDVPP